MRLFDTHGHISLSQFDEDRNEVIARMRENGVERALMAIDATEDVLMAPEMCAQDDKLCFAVGVHPHNAEKWTDECETIIEDASKKKGFVCVGEIGLDYYYDISPRDVQKEVFDKQIYIAKRLGFPMQLHIRDALGDAMDIMRAHYTSGTLPLTIMHCFAGSWEYARQCLNMGMYISLSGSVTFKNAPKLVEVAQNMPLDRLLIETDCPFLTPVPFRGKRNEPMYVRYTCEKIAEVRNVPVEEVAEAAYQNALRAFNIKEG